MHEDLKRLLDETVPKEVTLSEAKKGQILKAAQERNNVWKPARVPKFIPALVGIAVIGVSGLWAYPYLIEKDAPLEIQSGEENQSPSEENPELPLVEDENSEEITEETIEPPPEDSAEETEKEAEQLTPKQQLQVLLGHTYFNTGISLGDEVVEVEARYPNWIEKGEYEGGVALRYESFTLFHSFFETTINSVNLRGFNQLTVSQIEEAIEQEIKIIAYFNEMEGREIVSGEFILENERYVVVAESEDENARVKEISVSLYTE